MAVEILTVIKEHWRGCNYWLHARFDSKPVFGCFFGGGYVCNFSMLRSTHVFVILLLVNSSWLCLHLWARVNMHGHGDMPVVSTWTFFFFVCVCCILACTPHTDAFTYTKYSFDPLLLFKHHSTYCMNCVHVCHECPAAIAALRMTM